MQKSKEYYLLNEIPSLFDYLKNSLPDSSLESPRHREVCIQIMENPSALGLEKRIELFERRRFVNQHRRTISCPDLIGVYNGKYTVIEVGARKRASQQLLCAFRIFAMNFGIYPALIRVQYNEKSFTHHGMENARQEYDALMKERPEFKGCIWT